jgi:hypothetical protein
LLHFHDVKDEGDDEMSKAALRAFQLEESLQFRSNRDQYLQQNISEMEPNALLLLLLQQHQYLYGY